MNKLMKRVISGISAAAIFVSAMSLDVNIGTLYADDPVVPPVVTDDGGKWGSSDKDLFTDQKDVAVKDGHLVYNTNFGLHTNKTVSRADDDGRTFDLDLESWYIGEDPVDVGMVLDASGSMAWTTNTIYPLDLDKMRKSGELAADMTYDNLKAEQEAHDGYLKEETVEKILKPESTDNSKLGYNKYKYYVYESRPTVSEFVPLGFWDGGDDVLSDEKLIGFYPFKENLNNEAPKAVEGAAGKYIKHAEDTGNQFTDDAPTLPPKTPVFNGDNGDDLKLDKTAEIGGLLLDVDCTQSFTISMRVQSTISGTAGEGNCDALPLVYIGDSDKKNYIELVRSDTDFRKLKVISNKGQIINSQNTVFGSNVFGSNNKSWMNISLIYNGETGNIKLVACKNNTTDNLITDESSAKTLADFNAKGLKIIIGGDIDGHAKDYTDMLLTDFCVFNKALEDKELNELNTSNHIKQNGYELSFKSNEIAFYNFDDGSLDNSLSNSGGKLTLIKQADNDGFSLEPLDEQQAKATYKNSMLNLTDSASKGAVKLDSKPAGNKYTISFKYRVDGSTMTSTENLLYLGDNNLSNYYQIRTNDQKIELYKSSSDESTVLATNGLKENTTRTLTLVFDGESLTTYLNGGKVSDDTNLVSITELDNTSLKLILGALKDSYTGSNILIGDLLVFDRALNSSEVRKAYNTLNITQETCGKYHATTVGGTADIAQISESLAKNINVNERRGWYYVNSHSTWADIEGCLTSGKQYIGIKKEEDSGEDIYSHEDIATVPAAYDDPSFTSDKIPQSIREGDNQHDNYVPPTTERSIRFYVDDQNHLRCFVATGGTTEKEKEPRTFCSIVYVNDPEAEDRSEIKYETLNNALNNFFTKLYSKSALSNVSAVRFSTPNLVTREDRDTKLSQLIMLNWTNGKASTGGTTTGSSSSGIVYPRYPSANNADSAASVDGQYNYVMTGGTYTWTGLKAFYDNLQNADVVKDDKRPKYLIIFTDGRDNMVGDTSSVKHVHEQVTDNKASNYDKYKNSIGNFAPLDKDDTNQQNLNYDSELAKAWADKIKSKGYTIYCVMLATGSISPTTNETEYDNAADFLATLAGTEKITMVDSDDKNFENYVFISKPNSEESLDKQFDDILDQISVNLSSYTVQDYIDPRFDLIDNSNHLLKLGANGEVSVYELDEEGKIISGTPSKVIVKNAIESDVAAESYYEYTTKDNKKAKLYFDDDKDMYYLRWSVKSIGGGYTSFTTSDTNKQYLDEGDGGMWESTITVKAKDDFIGGNAILTNGNEAGMNLVFASDELYEADGTYKGEDEARRILASYSGTSNSVDRDNSGTKNGIENPSKGFPRTTVNVRLLPIDTEPLNDVIYMGELISPTMMLAELEDDYMTDSYYLEYLRRYAYRLYKDKEGTTKPLLELLNEWLGVNDTTREDKTFTIPYIYLPEPVYKDDNTIDKDNFTNNAGTENFNQKDIVGFLTYSWKKDGEPEEEQKDASGKPDITKEFVVKSADRQIKYILKLEFTPLHEEHKDSITESLTGKHFIDSKEEPKTFFNAEGGKFADADTWTFSTRDKFLEALVTESTSEGEGLYEWTPDYKASAGETQVVTTYGTTKGDPKYYYGDADIDGNSLTANTTYTKDVVNGALALEMIVKGSDLGEGKKIDKTPENYPEEESEDSQFIFEATRNYKDINDPLPYNESKEVYANADGVKYDLKFTVDNSTYPTDISDDEYYTIWAKLSGVKLSSEEKFGTPQLPIGTYTIEKKLDNTDEEMLVSQNGTEKTYFTSMKADNNGINFVHGHFPDGVTQKSANPKDADGVSEYLIWDEESGLDKSSENISKTDEQYTEEDSNKKLTFYMGTFDEKGNKDVKDDSKYAFAKERLGIILLSYGAGSLTFGKTVTNTTDPKNLDNYWIFKVQFTPSEDVVEEIEGKPFNLKWVDSGGNDITDDRGKSVVFEKSSDENTYEYTFSVKHGEKVTIQQLPINVPYTVSEIRSEQNEGFKDTEKNLYVTFVGSDDPENETDSSGGLITPASSVQFINRFWMERLPETGGRGVIPIMVLGASLSLMALVLLYLRKKNIVIKFKM